MWKRIEENESKEQPRVWKNEKSGEKVEVKKFKNNTWDTFHENELIENYDTKEEAIERGNELIGTS